MTLYMNIEPVHLLPEVKCYCNSYVIVYSKSIRNCGIAGKRDHWPASKDISLPYLTYYKKLSYRRETARQLPTWREGARPSSPLPLLWLHLCVWLNPKATTYVRQACRP